MLQETPVPLSRVPSAAGAPGSPQLLDEVLNELPVTDSVFHALAHTLPLAEALLDEVRELPAGSRVLAIGANQLLAGSLERLGYRVELWHLPAGSMSDELRRQAARNGSLDELLEGAEGEFDAVVAPFLLDAASEHPVSALERLAGLLAPGGRIIVVCRQAGALEHRLRSALGRSPLLDPVLNPPHVSLSWPTLVPRRTVARRDLHGWASVAGLEVAGDRLVVEKRATVPVDTMGVAAWLKAHALHRVKAALPAARDCLVATLVPHPIEPIAPGEPAPEVTVIAWAATLEGARRLQAELEGQGYPDDRWDAILVHPGLEGLPAEGARGARWSWLETAEGPGPAVFNAAVRRARGRVVAFTDDSCELPRNWLDAGASSIRRWTVGAAGRVLKSERSRAPFFYGLPGQRETGEQGFFPVVNSFYLRDALLQVGGFDERFQTPGRARWGWESTAAARLRGLGYGLDVEETLYVHRAAQPARSRGWIREEFDRARDLPSGLPRLRGVATRPVLGVFASNRTLHFDLLLAGVALAALRRKPAYLLLAAPWLAGTAGVVDLWPPRQWSHSARYARGLAARHLVWLAGLAAGSVERRRPLL